MGGTAMLTGRPGLPERERREREGVESLTDGAGLSAEARARDAGSPVPEERGGEARERRGLGQNWPSRGGRVFSFSFFIFYFFSFHFLLLFLFISVSFESIIF
jgi:hypothetical protein